MDSVEVRQRFTEYYENMGYKSLPRAPMMDPSIPMSFVMSAGLVQVENSLAKSSNRNGNRYVLVQECFRHFDLDKVGTDDIHLSLFEMPGAFVFGPDGKEGTIHKMWTLATDILGLEKERLWATYFNGGQVLNEFLPDDKTTRESWLKLDINNDHVVGLGTDHNFWIQGKGIDDSGNPRKCGPNTELFYDRGIERACGANCTPGCNCGRFIEFSNSLFICSEITKNERSIRTLHDPFTETVIGTERIAMIIQGVHSVFETDTFKPLVEMTCRLGNISPSSRFVPHVNVIADHIKGLYYLIANDAPPPGKDGRARIIKMLIRRVVTRLIILNINSDIFVHTILHSILEIVPSNMKAPWIQKRFASYFLLESRRFSKTIERGIQQLSRFIKENGDHTLTGSQIYCLERQWGLPIQLTISELNKKGLEFRESEYREACSIAKESISYDRRLYYVNP